MKRVLKKTTLAEQAYEHIKEMIVVGELAPGEELPEEKLAAELGISRTPLRDALKRLAVDALIELHAGRPATVAGFTKEDVQEIMELRKLLELYNIEQFVQSGRQETLQELKVNMIEQLRAIREKDFGYFMDMDQQFHVLLIGHQPNRRLRDLVFALNSGGSRAFLLLSDTIQQSATAAYKEHEAIMEAIERKDCVLAVERMADHLNNIENRMLNTIK